MFYYNFITQYAVNRRVRCTTATEHTTMLQHAVLNTIK